MRSLYFIQRQDGLIKIGFSKDVYGRVSTLSKTHGPLKLLGTIPQGREWLTHRKFQHLKEAGEWFRPGRDLTRFIKRHAVDGKPVDWQPMIDEAKAAGKNIPLQSLFVETVRPGDFGLATKNK